MSSSAALGARVRELMDEGAGDPVGLELVGALLARADALSAIGRERLLARAEALLEVYRARVVPSPQPAPPDPWREVLEARAQARRERMARQDRGATAALLEQIRAAKATARAAEQVPEAAGPYNGAAVAARVLNELAALAPGYVSGYVACLEDLACLAELPDRRAGARKKG